MGALAMDSKKLDINHFRSITEAIAAALPGDTIELGDGHYWINDPLISVDIPLRIIGDEHDPSHVVIETCGTINWKGKKGFIEGCMFRRPKMSSSESGSLRQLLCIEQNAKIDIVHCVFDNDGSNSTACILGSGFKGRWEDVTVKSAGCDGSGIELIGDSKLLLVQCQILKNNGNGVLCKDNSIVKMVQCTVERNQGAGVLLMGSSSGQLIRNNFVSNAGGAVIANNDLSVFVEENSFVDEKQAMDEDSEMIPKSMDL